MAREVFDEPAEGGSGRETAEAGDARPAPAAVTAHHPRRQQRQGARRGVPRPVGLQGQGAQGGGAQAGREIGPASMEDGRQQEG